jgi:hypothetical protein
MAAAATSGHECAGEQPDDQHATEHRSNESRAAKYAREDVLRQRRQPEMGDRGPLACPHPRALPKSHDDRCLRLRLRLRRRAQRLRRPALSQENPTQ